jgi:hypothetical protein
MPRVLGQVYEEVEGISVGKPLYGQVRRVRRADWSLEVEFTRFVLGLVESENLATLNPVHFRFRLVFVGGPLNR